MWNQYESKILTSSVDKTVLIWDAVTGEELVKLAGNTGNINQATWSQDESKILTSNDDGIARIWDAATGKVLITLAGHTQSVRQATYWLRLVHASDPALSARLDPLIRDAAELMGALQAASARARQKAASAKMK